MLSTKAVEESTLELIISLQSKPYIQGFYLVGGTALALHLGHRKSVDIYLFSNFDFDTAGLLENIHQDYHYQLSFSSMHTLKGSIGNINVDILAHRYSLISEPSVIQGVTTLSIPDIIAMKLNAISVSGQRSKDFIDIYYLLKRYSLERMLKFYQEKYNQQNIATILKSLIYFEEVDLADWPVIIDNPELKWTKVRKKLEKVVLDYTNQK
jgi:hypothetical protein